MTLTPGRFLTTIFAVFLSLPVLAQTVTISTPASGATVSTSIHVSAYASGGAYPISATRLYLDNSSVTTVSGSKIDTYATSATGSHKLTIVSWDTLGRSFVKSESVNVVVPAKVTISSPSSTSTSSPVRFVATATAQTGRTVAAIAVYVDNSLKYATAGGQLDKVVSVATGNHSAIVQSWDNAGIVTKAQKSFAVGTTTSNSGSGSTGAWGTDLSSTSNWLATQSLPSGALMYSSLRINPYYANLAAIGLLRDPSRYVQVENWMRWYIGHLNHTDKWGVGGTMYDYNIVAGKEISSGDADSTDSYAATFLSLAYEYYATGNPAAQSYVRSIANDLKLVAQVLAKTQESDGLTWAKPDYHIKYLMDNAEVYRGLADAATLFGSIGDTGSQSYYSNLALKCQVGLWSMFLGKSWAVYKDALDRLAAPNLAVWYPDASAQVFPVLYRAIPAGDSRAQAAYATFNQAWPNWTNLSYATQDPFPWAMVGHAAALMGDKTRASAHAVSLRTKWEDKGFPWTWYSMEAGWYMRLASYMQGGKP